ncbi:MAG: hypothetical protein IPK26_23875 [Planctomycetes bacterium]|nr:hypothetical protein [Planctomycetota bacterium]
MVNLRPASLFFLAAAALAQNPCGEPHLLGMPFPSGAIDGRLNDVFAFSNRDLWAVGNFARELQGNRNTYSWILHWDGDRFTQVPSPSPGIPNLRTWCELHAVGGSSPNDVWAAGTYERQFPNNGHVGPQILLLHWDGSSWTQIPEPLPQFTYMASSSGTRVDDIVALGPNDVWFFGWWPGDQFTSAGPLSLHWDGSNWAIDIGPLPNSNSRWGFVDVDAVSPNEFFGVASTGSGNYGHWFGRWNGSSWSRITGLPTQPVTYYQLTTVCPVGSNDVWIGGVESALSGGGGPVPYVLRWNGSSFTRHAMRGFPNEMVAFAANDIWAFGTSIEHWNGTAWTLVQDLQQNLLSAQGMEAIATGPCELWTVGTQWSGTVTNRVLPLAARVGGAQGGSASLRLPCFTPQLRQSLLPLTTPRIGRTLRVVVDDPLGTFGMSTGIPTMWLFAFTGGVGFPCGTTIPGPGIGGTSIEVMLDNSATVATTAIWTGPGQPAEHVVPVPAIGSLVGVTFATQAAFLDTRGVAMTSALDLRVGQ